MTMDSSMLLPRDGDPRESTSLSVALLFSDNAYVCLAYIVKVGEGFGTFDKRSKRFNNATINSR